MLSQDYLETQRCFGDAETDVMDESEAEEVLLDENAEAKKHKFYMVGGFSVSPDQTRLAYSEDTKGGEKYTLHVKDLQSGKELLSKPIPVSGNLQNVYQHMLFKNA